MKLIVFLIILLFPWMTALPQHKTEVQIINANQSVLQKEIAALASDILLELSKSNAARLKPELGTLKISPAAKKNMLALWETAPFFCTEIKISARLISQKEGNLELRPVPFVVQTTEGPQNEEGVLIFNKNGMLEDIYFGLETHQYENLLSKGKNSVDFKRRQIILDFVENFRTAYNRKDIAYLDNVFSDNALIIVGSVIEKQDAGVDMLERNLGYDQVQLIKKNKKDYITDLKKTFAMNKFIKVGFDKIDITQHRKYSYLYGVTLEQKWQSSNYSDKGYIFLMIDFKNEVKPLIHVRSWQPKEFTREEQVLGLGDFDIIE